MTEKILPRNCGECEFVDFSWINWEKERIGYCHFLKKKVTKDQVCSCPEVYINKKEIKRLFEGEKE